MFRDHAYAWYGILLGDDDNDDEMILKWNNCKEWVWREKMENLLEIKWNVFHSSALTLFEKLCIFLQEKNQNFLLFTNTIDTSFGLLLLDII